MSVQKRDPKALTRDDERAQRLASLVMTFTNASSPLSTDEIRRGLYGDYLNDGSFNTQFRRDRQQLALYGITILPVASAGPKPNWKLDQNSLAADSGLTQRDTLLITALCQPFLHNPEFVAREDLNMALLRIGRSFSQVDVGNPQSSDERGGLLSILLRGLSQRRLIRMTYRDAEGRPSECDVQVYGIYTLNKRTYFVCHIVKGPHQGDLRTYRLDRFEKAKPLGSANSYTIPDDFDVEEFRRLPFQIGPAAFQGVFRVPESIDILTKRQIERQGRHPEEDGQGRTSAANGTLWEIPVSNAVRAARWCIANGICPIAPNDLVDSYRGILLEVCSTDGQSR